MTGLGPQGSEETVSRLWREVGANPADLVARHNLAVELLSLDRPDQALLVAQSVWDGGLKAPEAATILGHAMLALGRHDEAVECYREAISIAPEHLSAHRALASLLPQIGKGAEALHPLSIALATRTGDPGLLRLALDTASAHRDYVRLLAWAETGQARFGVGPGLAMYEAAALCGLGRYAKAVDLLRPIVADNPGHAGSQAVLAQALLRLNDLAGAENAALAATQAVPDDQYGWALLSLIWRLRNDPREHWLCRYDELVAMLPLSVSADMADRLRARHRMQAHPADQSLRGGTQTHGSLFEAADPTIVALAEQIRDAVEGWLAHLPAEPDHPFLWRNTGRISFAGSWSVNLADGGHHVGHIHRVGWMSSAAYIALPASVANGDGGMLEFGVPDAAFALDLAPRRVIVPEPGVLVLFPSYLWHRTTPFSSPEHRLTVAFDALPVDSASREG